LAVMKFRQPVMQLHWNPTKWKHGKHQRGWCNEVSNWSTHQLITWTGTSICIPRHWPDKPYVYIRSSPMMSSAHPARF
jgi:hypothetical protein